MRISAALQACWAMLTRTVSMKLERTGDGIAGQRAVDVLKRTGVSTSWGVIDAGDRDAMGVYLGAALVVDNCARLPALGCVTPRRSGFCTRGDCGGTRTSLSPRKGRNRRHVTRPSLNMSRLPCIGRDRAGCCCTLNLPDHYSAFIWSFCLSNTSTAPVARDKPSPTAVQFFFFLTPYHYRAHIPSLESYDFIRTDCFANHVKYLCFTLFSSPPPRPYNIFPFIFSLSHFYLLIDNVIVQKGLWPILIIRRSFYAGRATHVIRGLKPSDSLAAV